MLDFILIPVHMQHRFRIIFCGQPVITKKNIKVRGKNRIIGKLFILLQKT